MQNRPLSNPLETALRACIKEKQLEAALELMNLIQKMPGASLSSMDIDGKSFLYIALESGMKRIADELLELQQNNDEILFAKSNTRNTILACAITQNYIDIVKRLVDIAAVKNKLQSYFEQNVDGDSILHIAINLRNTEAIEYILQQCCKHPHFNQFLQRANKNGDTALHCALSVSAINPSIQLINQDANLSIKNNALVSPVSLFSQLPEQTQTGIFSKLHKDKQSELLRHYRQLLISIPKNEHVKTNYFKLTGLHSLRSLLIALHEFNPTIPVRNYYNHTARTGDTTTYAVKFIDDATLESMPLYKEIIISAESGDPARTDLQHGNKIEDNIVEINTTTTNNMLEQDRITISSLIIDIENFLADLNQRPTISIPSRVLAIGIASALLLTYVGVEAWLGYCYNHASDEQNCTASHDSNFLGVLIFGMVGGILIVGASEAIIISSWNRPNHISHREWEQLTGRLQTEVIDKLHTLQEKQPADDEAYLPTAPVNIQVLDDTLASLDARHCWTGSPSSRPIGDVIRIFSRLKNTLETVRQDMNVSNKPMSLFFKPKAVDVIVDLEPDQNQDFERQPLLLTI